MLVVIHVVFIDVVATSAVFVIVRINFGVIFYSFLAVLAMIVFLIVLVLFFCLNVFNINIVVIIE